MPRSIRAALLCAAFCLAAPAAWAENAPGITDGEIKLGQTQPYSGPLAVFGAIGKAEAAYFKMIDDQGGVRGRKIVLVSRDDMFVTAKTVELTKQLIETDKVAAIFSIQGASSNLAIRDYLNHLGVPQLFTITGADVAGDFRHYPWTIGGAPLYRIEAQIYGRRIVIDEPTAKVAVLYQNDTFGQSYLTGLREVFHDSFDKRVVKVASYEPGDKSVAAQLKTLKESGADVLITAASADLAAQAIAGVYDMGWRPTHYLTFTAQSLSVLKAAGLDKSKGLISATSYMDPGDQRWTEDGSLKPYNDFVAKYLPGENPDNAYFLTGFIEAQAMVQVLKQCGDDLSRRNIMIQSANLKNFHPIGLLPGISFFTSRTQYHPIVEAALERFNGQKWELFGEVMAGQ